jgi:hypothetical protein
LRDETRTFLSDLLAWGEASVGGTHDAALALAVFYFIGGAAQVGRFLNGAPHPETGTRAGNCGASHRYPTFPYLTITKTNYSMSMDT